jgi:hypothetical protein
MAPVQGPSSGSQTCLLCAGTTIRPSLRLKGIPEAQARLSKFYELGDALPKDAVLVDGWLAIAANTVARTSPPFSPNYYKSQLDRIVATKSSQVIAEGKRFANLPALPQLYVELYTASPIKELASKYERFPPIGLYVIRIRPRPDIEECVIPILGAE